MDIMLDDGNTIQICPISNTLDYVCQSTHKTLLEMAKAQPRKPMKMPLPPLPNGSGAPALPPRRGAPPPIPPPQDEYDDFSVEDDEQNYDDFDIEDKSPPLPAFKPPPTPTAEPDENYDEFEGISESPSGPSVYVMDEVDDPVEAPVPPPPPASSRPKLPKIPVHEEVEYMDPDEDENISAGSTSSTGSNGPPVPGNRRPELPSRVEKPKKTVSSGFVLDQSTLTNMKNKLTKVGFNKKPEKKKEEEKANIFAKLKPVTPKKPDNTKPKENGISSSKSKPKPEIPKPEIPKPEIPKPHKPKPEIPSPNEELKDQEDDFEEQMYDDAASIWTDPLDAHDWYHGLVTRQESNKRLESVKSDGAFLVRKSTKDNSHPYTLAVMFQNNIHNLKIRIRDDEKYALGEYKENEVMFSSLPEVIEHHKQNDVILIGQKTGTVKLKKTPRKK